MRRLSSFFKREDPMWAQFRLEAEKKALLTPDLAELKTFSNVNVFVYNEIQSEQPQNELVSMGLYRGIGYTKQSDFVLYKKLLGKETFPFALQITEDQRLGMSSYLGDPGQIMGEVYTIPIPAERIIALDEYMLNTVYFDRKRVTILVPFRTDPASDKFDMNEIEAFMYVGRQEFWNEQITKSDSNVLFAKSQRLFANKEDNIGAYYTFDYKVEATKE